MNKFSPNSQRAQKSRIAIRFTKKTIFLLKVITVVSIFSSQALLFLNSSLGYLVLVPATFCLCLLAWNKGELQNLGKRIDTRSIDGQLDPSVLAHLKNSSPSAQEIWLASKDTEARYFVQNRFMVDPSILDQRLSSQPESGDVVWQKAEDLKIQYKTAGYPAVLMIVALLYSIPEVEKLLAPAQINLKEVEGGISWLEDIYAKRELASKKQRFGGWARDWTYGYTPILRYLGHNISQEVQRFGFFEDTTSHAKIVDQLIKAIGSGSSSIALVGDAGVGKTTTVYAFAEKILAGANLPSSIRHHQVVALDAPTILSQARGPGELEQLMIRLINETYKAKNIILFLDDSYAFFSQEASSVDLSKILQPALDSGSIRIILAMTPKELQQVNAVHGGLASKIQTLQVTEPSEEEVIHVLRDKVLTVEYQKKVLFTHQAIKEAYRLGKRYVEAQVMPGAALSTLESTASTAQQDYITAAVVQGAVEASTGVKLQHATRDESQVLLSLEDELHKYVINQKQAVGVISDALRRSRSGVGNTERPVGTFLFLGPTGVGKTELSKALARVYFGNVDAVIRVDMNQFVQPEDTKRLITPMLGDQLGLLGEIRKQPFSVVLFDEIEKAHPNVINALLQMLDEGTMKDIDNKPVSFKDAILIATSNAGADEIRRMLDSGEDIVKAHDKLIDHIISQKIFAPEFVNRFDEVVIFRPLTPEELIKVIDLIIAGINKTLDSKKVQVEVSEEAKKWLVEKGYDARLGARPMRRVAQKYIENILAKRLLTDQAESGATIKLDTADFENLEGSAE